MNDKPIDVETVPESQALAVREQMGVGRALTVEELHRNLEFIREVMRKEMRVGQDYGKIPGTGDKPTLLQPGAQKLLMTFNLTETVKREVMRDFPGYHREYEFVVTVKAANGKEWDGVGTCSTLEAKYRYRKAERKCPACGHTTIIAESPKFLKAGQVAGWLCWKKKGGCGKTFAKADPQIVNQGGGRTENPDPADCWNTVRKMAFKRALVAAAINATNTSDLWTQDLEERLPDDEPPEAPEVPEADTPRTPKKPLPFPTVESRAKMIEQLKARVGEANREIVSEFFAKATETKFAVLEDLPLRFVPATTAQMRSLGSAIAAFGNGEQAGLPYPPHPEPTTSATTPATAPPAPPPAKPIEVPRDTNCDPNSPNAAWRNFPVPWGKHAGVPLAKLDKNVLFGFYANFVVEETWTDKEGNERDCKPEQIAKNRRFREMLDEAGKHYEFRRPDDAPDAEAETPPTEQVPF